MNKKGWIAALGIPLFLVTGFLVLAFVFGDSGTEISDGQLFELNKKCKKMADKFAEEKTRELDNSSIEWRKIRSKYVPEKKSCYGEYKIVAIREGGSSFTEYWIENLSTGETVVTHNLIDTSGKRSETLPEGVTKEPTSQERYSMISRNLFGSVVGGLQMSE